jgi:hypothetical protein
MCPTYIDKENYFNQRDALLQLTGGSLHGKETPFSIEERRFLDYTKWILSKVREPNLHS